MTHRTAQLTAHCPPPAAGFTLIEMMVVIAVIGILSTLLIIGVEKLMLNAKRQQTRGTFSTLTALYGDFDAQVRTPFAPSNMPCPQNVAGDVNPAPSSSTTTMSADDTTMYNRYGAAVWFTRDLMYNLQQFAGAKTALGKMSPGSLMTFPAAYNNAGFPKPYGGNIVTYPTSLPTIVTYVPFNGAPTNTASDYGRTSMLDPTDLTNQTTIYFDCIQTLPSGATTTPNVDRAHWLPAYPKTSAASNFVPDDTVPVLLDAWGNPIIFVPGGTLGVVPNTNNVVNGAAKLGSGAMVSGSGAAAIPTTASTPNGRPFFASAGPDGDFSKGDDNLYSFE